MALNIAYTGDYHLFGATLPDIKHCPVKPPDDAIHIGAMQAGQTSNDSWPVSFKDSYSTEELKALAGHQAGLMMHTCIYYSTILNEQRALTESCSVFYVLPDGRTFTCPGFDEMK
jgi:hypothetical protein